MTELEDAAPEALPLAIALGEAAVNCAEAGMSLGDCIEVIASSYEAWFGRDIRREYGE